MTSEDEKKIKEVEARLDGKVLARDILEASKDLARIRDEIKVFILPRMSQQEYKLKKVQYRLQLRELEEKEEELRAQRQKLVRKFLDDNPQVNWPEIDNQELLRMAERGE